MNEASIESMSSCIEDCLACVIACNECYSACLEEPHSASMRNCIRLDRECADLCAFTVQAITMGSSYRAELVLLCAEACQRCGEACAEHDHEHCRRCAEACLKCAASCLGLAQELSTRQRENAGV
ncbi:four-helix bundle copper-binding protein [Cohnella sp. GCM10020058]|uniref:four-helix bundle copper-binding protein n=1 Tax=Cohnella sp. GCM10020058 TaxID=3317330 RepID=UPI0036297DC7